MSAMRAGNARIFLDAEPESGQGHAGYRGWIKLDAIGAHFLEGDMEYLALESDEWEKCAGDEVTIPLHRIFQIDWLPEPDDV